MSPEDATDPEEEAILADSVGLAMLVVLGALGPAERLAWRAQFARRALVNGAAGLVVVPHDRPYAIIGFTVRTGRIVQIDILADPARLRQLNLATLGA